MKIWIDTEFNGYKGALLSVALVAEDGREFYEVLHSPEMIVDWVSKNVIPVLNKAATFKHVVKPKLAEFLSPYDDIHVIADWPDDIRHFCDLLITGPGTRIDTPTLTMEIRRDLDGAVSKIPHNALEDARAIKEEYLRLTSQETDCRPLYNDPKDPAFVRDFTDLHRFANLAKTFFSLNYREVGDEWWVEITPAKVSDGLITLNGPLSFVLRSAIEHLRKLSA